MTPELAGLVLCGGAGRRMGRDKALIEVEGRPLVRLVAEELSRVAEPVILASGRAGRLGPVAGGLVEVSDALPDAGPLAGVAAGLRASPRQLLAVAAVDMPFVNAAVFALLAALRADEDAVVPVTAEGIQPLHAVYAASARAPLEAALGARRLSLRSALDSLRLRLVTEQEWRAADPTGRFADNLNTPQDLAGLFSPG